MLSVNWSGPFWEFMLSGVRLTLPLLFAAYGGLFTEKSGVANIALEAHLLLTSFVAASTMTLTHSFAVSWTTALLSSAILSLVFWFFTTIVKADQIIVGMALNLLAMGIVPVLCRTFFGVSGQTPALDYQFQIGSLGFFTLLALLIWFSSEIILKKTVWGLRLIACGENPDVLDTVGVKRETIRLGACLLGSLIVAVGGVYLSIGVGSGFTRNMSAGRGFIALAALIFGRWRPFPTMIGCLIFGFAEAAQITLQTFPLLPGDRPLPIQLIHAFPYLLTLTVVALWSGKVKAPAAINKA